MSDILWPKLAAIQSSQADIVAKLWYWTQFIPVGAQGEAPGLLEDGKELVWAVGEGTGMVEDMRFEDDKEGFWITRGTLWDCWSNKFVK